MPVFNNVLSGAAGQSGGAGDFKIERSLRFDHDGAGSYLERTATGGNRQKWCWSGWVKRSGTGWLFVAGADNEAIYFTANGNLVSSRYSGGFSYYVETEAVYRDFSSWYHIAVLHDHTIASPQEDRIKVFVNGIRVTQFKSGASYPAQGNEFEVNNNGATTRVGRYLNGYLAEVHFFDNKTPTTATDNSSGDITGIPNAEYLTELGEFDADTGVWSPIAFTETHESSAVSYSNNNQITIDSGNYYLNNQGGPNGFDGNSSTYIDCRLGTGSNNTTNIIFQPTGGIANVTKIRVHSEYADDYRINNGTWTSFSSGGSYTQIYNGSAFTLTKLEIRRTSNGGSNYGHRVTAYEINDSELVNTPAGVNGFHLDFSNPSALGNDAAGSNDFTINNLIGGPAVKHEDDVSVQVNGAIDTSNNPERHKLFDGISANYCYAYSNDSSNYILWAPSGGYTTPGYIWIQGGDGNGNGLDTCTVQINGTTVTSTDNVNNAVYSSASYGWGRWWKYPVSGNTLTSLKVIKEYTLLRRLSTVADPTWATLGISSDDDVPSIDSIAVKDVDSLLDSPSNYEANSGNNGGNYCVLNPLDKHSEFTTSNGNLDVVTSGSNWRSIRGTIGISSGKYYWEFTTGHQRATVGIATSELSVLDDYIGNNSYSWSYLYDGNKYHNGGIVSYGSSYTAGDIIGVAFDADAGNIYFYKNGTIQNNGTAAYTGLTSGPYFPSFSFRDSGNTFTANFGASSFAYTPPTGYKSLCTQNLDDPLIADPSTAFDVVTWAGNNSSPRTISGMNMSPDFIWSKARDELFWHNLADSVRGPSRAIHTNRNDAENTNNDIAYGSVSAFNSDGFTLTSGNDGTIPHAWVNMSGKNYVAWAWEGGDLVTNSAYNQSRTWSAENITSTGNTWSIPPDSVGVTATNLFDGTLTTSVGPYSTGTITVPFGTTFSGAKTWRVLWQPWVNGETIEDQSGNTLVTVSGSLGTKQYYSFTGTNISGLKFTANGSGNSSNIYAIEVDGKILVDPGVIPAGSLNSSLYNQSQTWSSGIASGSSPNSSYGVANVFNGVKTGLNNTCFVNNGSFVQVDFSTLSSASTVTVHYTANGSGVLKVNGVNQTIDGSGHNVYRSVTVNVSGLSSVRWSQADGSNFVGVSGIEVDGKLLVDSSVTPPSVPTISATVRANPTAGISIIKYVANGTAGVTVAHQLGKKPEFMLAKNLDYTSGQNWFMYHKVVGAGGGFNFNANTSAYINDTGYWNGTEPTSNVITLGNYHGSFGTHNHILYAFATIEGFSAVGSFEGQSSPTPYVYTGFAPRWILIGNMDNVNDFVIYDTARSQYNVADEVLAANSNNHEGNYTSGYEIDILSNGFKIRSSSSGATNQASHTHVWVAFASNPFKYARAA